jgi:hypothetical protein
MTIHNRKVISHDSNAAGMDAFSAIADPKRRAMLDMFVERSRSAGDIVNAFPRMSHSLQCQNTLEYSELRAL